MTDPDLEQLLLEAEAKWSTGDDEGAAGLLEEALVAVWGRPDEVARVSETATRLAQARDSKPVSEVARRAAGGAEALDDFTTRVAEGDAAGDKTARGRGYFRLIQLGVFTVVVITLIVVQYVRMLR